jgi:multiple sugar transport system permease protein
MFFFPTMISMTAVALTFQYMFSTHNGIVNYFVSFAGLEPVNWLGTGSLAMAVVMLTLIWKNLGWDMLVFIGGLQTISREFLESAMIDGATRWQSFRFITLPLLRPTFLFVLVTSVISSFKVFDVVYVMTQGGPSYATTTIVQYIYRSAFKFFEMGAASASAYVLFIIIIAFTLVQWRFLWKEP